MKMFLAIVTAYSMHMMCETLNLPVDYFPTLAYDHKLWVVNEFPL